MARTKPNPLAKVDDQVEVRRLQGAMKLVTFELFMQGEMTLFTPALAGDPSKRGLEGAIVRIRPGVGVPDEEIASLRSMVEAGKPARVIVLPRPREAVIPAAVAATRSAMGAREAVLSLINESNSRDRKALFDMCEKVMAGVGL